MDSHDSHRIAVQLKRIADALERAYPPPPKPKKEPKPRRGVVY